MHSAKEQLTVLVKSIFENKKSAELGDIVDEFYNSDFDINTTNNKIVDFANQTELSAYTVWLLMFVFASKRAKKSYLEKDVDEDVFWDTFSDLRCKAL